MLVYRWRRGSKPHKKWRANTTIVDSFHSSTTIKKKTGITENAASICARKLSDVDDDDGYVCDCQCNIHYWDFCCFISIINWDIYFYIWRFIIPTKWHFSKESIANFMAHLILVSSFLFFDLILFNMAVLFLALFFQTIIKVVIISNDNKAASWKFDLAKLLPKWVY